MEDDYYSITSILADNHVSEQLKSVARPLPSSFLSSFVSHPPSLSFPFFSFASFEEPWRAMRWGQQRRLHAAEPKRPSLHTCDTASATGPKRIADGRNSHARSRWISPASDISRAGPRRTCSLGPRLSFPYGWRRHLLLSESGWAWRCVLSAVRERSDCAGTSKTRRGMEWSG